MTDITTEEALKILTDWRQSQPRYQGDDPRSKHYRKNIAALDLALAALSGTPTMVVTDFETFNAAVADQMAKKHELVEWSPLETIEVTRKIIIEAADRLRADEEQRKKQLHALIVNPDVEIIKHTNAKKDQTDEALAASLNEQI